MRRCAHPRDRVWLELMDDRLIPEARRAAEAHLVGCPRCAARASAMRTARQACAGLASSPLAEEAPHLDREHSRWSVAAAMAAIVVVSGALWRLDGPRVVFEEGLIGQLPSTLERAARTQHDRAARNAVALDVVTTAPADIRTFLKQQHAPFANLAVRRAEDERSTFVPVGAALMQAGGAPASAVFYRINGAPVTLLATRTADLDDPPERSFVGLRITHRQANGLHTYAWTQAGQSYTLATTLSARQACRMCHADAAFAERLTRETNYR
jgi:anti-sigma factor RsiW